jgi:predicted AlkP superfamily pyrophosphatase or phosphodiesterase
MKRTFLPLCILIILLWGCPGKQPSQPEKPYPQIKKQYLILISVDGLRAEFYLNAKKYKAKNFEMMCREGAYAKSVKTVYPSVTYPAHATISTGVYPAKHGIIANTIFDFKRGYTGKWYWHANYLKSKPIWAVAKENHLKVASLSWPSTLGANIDYLIPEIWDEKGFTVNLIRRYSTRGLAREIFENVRKITDNELDDTEKRDRFLTEVACYLIKKYKPDLLLLHLLLLDHVQHTFGKHTQEIIDAVEKIDQCIGLIIKTLRQAGIADRTTIMVVGDHGFINTHTIIYPNAILKKEGLIQNGRWKALAHVSGSQCAIYLKNKNDKQTQEKVLEIFKKYQTYSGRKIYNIITREKLDRWQSLPDAFISLECEKGYLMSGYPEGPIVEKAQRKGSHGFSPERREMDTGFIVWGNRAKRVILRKIKLIDIAPTACAFLKIEMKDVQGKILPIIK